MIDSIVEVAMGVQAIARHTVRQGLSTLPCRQSEKKRVLLTMDGLEMVAVQR